MSISKIEEINMKKNKEYTICGTCKKKTGHKKGCLEYTMGYRKGQSDIYKEII